MTILPAAEAADLAQHEAAVERGLSTFVDVGTSLLAAESDLSPAAFDLFCRVHAGGSAAQVRPFLDLVRDLA